MVKVMFIGGAGRSGSTLLDRLVGQMEGFVSTGEMRYLWERPFKRNLLCGCGAPFRSCPFWTAVLECTFGSLRRIDIDHMIALQQHVERKLTALQVLMPRLTLPTRDQAFREYQEIMTRLYRTIAEVSHSPIVVDSSKNASRGFLLAAMPSVRLCTVHLVRDSRAVTFSWQRKRVRPEVRGTMEYMDVHGVRQCIAEWVGHNRLIAALRKRSQEYSLVRYEDLVADPRSILRSIAERLGQRGPKLDFIETEKAVLRPGHTVDGNPMRFAAGDLKIKLDDEWRSQLPLRQKLLVTACTWPYLLKYGYSVTIRRQ